MSDDIFEIFEEIFDLRRKRGRRFEETRGGYDYRPEPPPPPAPPKPPIFCPKCGTKNDAAGRYCESCGELLPAPGEEMRCPNCNSPVALTATFCARCGARVAPANTGEQGGKRVS